MIRAWIPPFPIGAIFLLVLLAGCAETALVVDQAKRLSPPAESKGVYKVGEPYRVGGVWYYPAADYEYSETGIASWYGPGFDGKPTANGELFDMNALTAAHRTLPMPSMVRVTNLENGRSVTLRVNDRGPFAHGRIIDVSRRAAQLLGFEGKGTARVRVEILPEESRMLAMRAGAGSSAPALPNEPKPKAAPSVAIASEALPSPNGATSGPVAQESQPAVVASSTQVAAVEVPVEEGQLSIQPVQPTQLFVQAGAFVDYQNAYRLSARLSPLGRTQVTSIFSNDQQFFRVRLGPINSVEEADRLLERVIDAGHPEARIIVQ